MVCFSLFKTNNQQQCLLFAMECVTSRKNTEYDINVHDLYILTVQWVIVMLSGKMVETMKISGYFSCIHKSKWNHSRHKLTLKK